MLFNEFLHTGTRLIDQSAILRIDLWHTDANVQLTLAEQGKLLLDADESRIIRDWAAKSMEAAIMASQWDLLAARVGMQEQLLEAAKLNRRASRAASRARKQPAKVAHGAGVVDINVWRRAAEQPAVELALAA
jgi:hypothetical protein